MVDSSVKSSTFQVWTAHILFTVWKTGDTFTYACMKVVVLSRKFDDVIICERPLDQTINFSNQVNCQTCCDGRTFPFFFREMILMIFLARERILAISFSRACACWNSVKNKTDFLFPVIKLNQMVIRCRSRIILTDVTLFNQNDN